MNAIKEFLSHLAGCIRTDEDVESQKNEMSTLMLIKKYHIRYMIFDRLSGKEIVKCSLSNYDEKKHQLIVDAYEFMEYCMKRE